MYLFPCLGLIIESRTSRDSSPNRGTSPFSSPRVSPAYHMSDRSFVLPTSGGARPRIPSSTSDNTIFSGKSEMWKLIKHDHINLQNSYPVLQCT